MSMVQIKPASEISTSFHTQDLRNVKEKPIGTLQKQDVSPLQFIYLCSIKYTFTGFLLNQHIKKQVSQQYLHTMFVLILHFLPLFLKITGTDTMTWTCSLIINLIFLQVVCGGKIIEIILGLQLVSLEVIEMILPYVNTLFCSQITY